MIRSDFLINTDATFNCTDTINGVVADSWSCIGGVNGANNYAATQTEDRRPVAFWELKNNLTKRWDFDMDSYVAGPPDESVFAIPDDCSKFCPIFEEGTVEIISNG